jgi:hypothetical protein
MVMIMVEVPDEEMERITARARERGYGSPGDYLRALVEQDLKNAHEDSGDA